MVKKRVNYVQTKHQIQVVTYNKMRVKVSMHYKKKKDKITGTKLSTRQIREKRKVRVYERLALEEYTMGTIIIRQYQIA